MVIPVFFAQVNLVFTGPGLPGRAEVTFGVANSTAMDASTIAAAVFNSAVTADFCHDLHNSVGITSIIVKKGPNATGEQVEVTDAIPGEALGTAGPANTAFLVRKVTGEGGAKQRGRWFLPGVPAEAISSGQFVSTAYATDLETKMTSFLSQLDDHDIPMVLLHGGADAPTPVNYLLVQSRLATQRRRLRG
jgi:hypothetical protein